MMKFLTVLMAATIAVSASPAMAETASPAPKKAAKSTAKKSSAKKSAADAGDEPEADVTGSTVTEYSCANGSKITVYRNPADPENVALRWNNKITRMKRVQTDSGAERLEHEKRGLVFIGIPAKAMLLDSKQGRQLANDCKSAEQMVSSESK
jgi:membrane-bound inhibitor of C-type lysozyme